MWPHDGLVALPSGLAVDVPATVLPDRTVHRFPDVHSIYFEVLGEPVMRALQQLIRGCPEPMILPQAGHFVQEHGEAIARAAAAHFTIR